MASTWPGYEGNDVSDEDGVPDIEDEGDAEEEVVVHETMFTFEAFEMVRRLSMHAPHRSGLTKIFTIESGGRNLLTPRLHGHCWSTSHATRNSTLLS